MAFGLRNNLIQTFECRVRRKKASWHVRSGLVARSRCHFSKVRSGIVCVAVCCSVLQCVAVCCRVLQCVAVCCGVLQTTSQRSALELFLRVTQTHFKDRGAVCCSVLQCATVAQCVAVCYIVLQCVAVCCSVQVNLLYPLDTELTFFSV